jgi:chromate transport protein ChrA
MTTPEPASPDALTPALPQRRSLREIVIYFLRLGTLGFGGPVALVGLMEKELVQDRGWLSKEEMRDAVAVSQSLPGPLAIRPICRCGRNGAFVTSGISFTASDARS